MSNDIMTSDNFAITETTETAIDQADNFALAETDAITLNPADAKIAKFIHQCRDLYKISKMYAASPLMPDVFKNNPAAVISILYTSIQLGIPVVTLANEIYIVHGKAGYSGKMMLTLMKRSGRFRNIVYKTQESDDIVKGTNVKNTSSWYEAVNVETGQIVKGAKVSIQMAVDEGWYGKPGSKWKTMPEIMLAYRAAAFFVRMHCPEMTMGLMTTDEIEEIERNTIDVTPKTPEELKEQIRMATTTKEIKKISRVAMNSRLAAEDKNEVSALYRKRKEEIRKQEEQQKEIDETKGLF